MHIDDQVMTKLENKRKKNDIMGYDKKSKGYKFYNLNEENMVISRDVEFDEERA
jgi:predicted acetyltransferase